MRDRWIAAVLRTDELNPSCKLVCIALSRHMDDRGNVSYRQEDLALEVGMKSVNRVGDRIREAKNAMFLSHIGGGINGTTARYQAMVPLSATPSRGGSSTGSGTGPRGGRNGGAETAASSAPAPPSRGAIRARTTYKNREQQPAPDDSREQRDYLHAVSSSNDMPSLANWLVSDAVDDRAREATP